jgi:hypothetical protein
LCAQSEFKTDRLLALDSVDDTITDVSMLHLNKNHSNTNERPLKHRQKASTHQYEEAYGIVKRKQVKAVSIYTATSMIADTTIRLLIVQSFHLLMIKALR